MQKNYSDLTVVIPVLNREKLIKRTLDSIKSQTQPPKRVIVVDNGSRDNTLSLLQNYSRTELPFEFTILQESKPGAAAARNRGLRETDTTFMLFFDSDDIMPPHHISEIVKHMTAPYAPELLILPRLFVYPDGRRYKPHFTDGDLIASHIVHSCAATLGTAMRTDLAKRIGGWNENLTGWDDYEFGLRLCLSAKRIARIDSTYPIIYHQPESLTGNDFISKRGVWEKALDSMERILRESTRPGKQKWLNWLRYRRVILEAHYARESAEKGTPYSGRPDALFADIPLVHRLALKLCYIWTRRGLRGAHYLYRRVNGL